MPAALTAEKDGSYTNTQRLVQLHDKAVDPPGDCRSEAWFVHRLGLRLRELYAGDHSPRGRQINALTWDYPTLDDRVGDPDLNAVVREINGYSVADGRPVKDYTELKDDGSTACGCWIYSGIMLRRRPKPARATGRATSEPRSAGASPGRATTASCTTVRRPTLTATRGASAKMDLVGRRSKHCGPATTCRISLSTKRPTTSPLPAQWAWLRTPATRRSCDLRRQRRSVCRTGAQRWAAADALRAA